MVHARHTPTHIPTSPFPYPLISPHTHTHTHTHIHTHAHTHHTHTHTHAHPHTCTHTAHTHMHIHTHLEGAFPELLCQCAQGLLNGEGGIHGEGEFGDILQHLQHALLLREKVVEGLRKHQ